MSTSAKPGWPDLSGLPFNLFAPTAATAAPTAPSPLAQGFAGGVDAMKQFWGSLPGGSAVPGFLVPTLDVDELDKRISDLRAAESWVEVNLNMLRATIQGLEVQRNTIAAIRSLSAMAEGKPAAPPAASHGLPSGLPSGWPMSEPVAPAKVASPVPVAVAEPAATEESGTPAAMMAGLAANNWLSLLQDQFARVAQAAVATSTPTAAAKSTGMSASKKAATGTTKKAAKSRRPVVRKRTEAR